MMFPHDRYNDIFAKKNCNMKDLEHNCQRWCSMLQQHANAARASCILDAAMQKQGIKHAQQNLKGSPSHTILHKQCTA